MNHAILSVLSDVLILTINTSACAAKDLLERCVKRTSMTVRQILASTADPAKMRSEATNVLANRAGLGNAVKRISEIV